MNRKFRALVLTVSALSAVAIAGPQPAWAVTTLSDNQWSGYNVLSSAPAPNYVRAYFEVPPLSCPKSAPIQQLGMWVGLGGVASKDGLFQNGIIAQCRKGVITYGVFWEYVATSQGSVAPVLLDPAKYPVKARDRLSVSAVFEGGAVAFNWDNAGQSATGGPPTGPSKWSTYHVTQDGFTETASRSAECILERPQLPNSKLRYPLPTFSAADWPACYFGQSGVYVDLAKSGETPPAGDQIQRRNIVSSTTKNQLTSTSRPSTTGDFKVAFLKTS